MARLKIKNETVYVIYRDGEPYQGTGRKLVYTTRGAAAGVITTEATDIAKAKYNKGYERASYKASEWYRLSEEQTDALIDQAREGFEIVEYGPKGGVK